MAKPINSKAEFAAAEAVHRKNPLPRIGRMVLCVLSMGMIYPNAFSEGIDMEEFEARNDRSPKQ